MNVKKILVVVSIGFLHLKEIIEHENSLEAARASFEQFEKEQAKRNRAKHEKTAAWISRIFL